MPEYSLKFADAFPDELLESPDNFRRIAQMRADIAGLKPIDQSRLDDLNRLLDDVAGTLATLISLEAPDLQLLFRKLGECAARGDDAGDVGRDDVSHAPGRPRAVPPTGLRSAPRSPRRSRILGSGPSPPASGA